MTAFFLVPVWGFAGPALWIVVIALIVVSTRGTRATARDSQGPAVRLLEERYARGDIGREEFLERRAVLEGISPGASQ